MSENAEAITPLQLRAMLAHRVREEGGQAAFGRRYGISQSQVSEALNGRRDLTPAMVTALGFIAVTRYLPVRKRDGGKPSTPQAQNGVDGHD